MRILARVPMSMPGAQSTLRVALTSFAPALGMGLLAAGLVTVGPGQRAAEAKTPGKTYCFHGKCHRVRTIAETEALVGTEETLNASHYDSCKRDRYNPCGLTSSGAVFDADAPDNAASPIYPDGTTLLVWSQDTRASIVLRVNNAGPYWGDRKLDVSRAAADVLGFSGQGVATLKVRVLYAPTVAEATYSKNRTYDPVPGYIGQFASLDDAHVGAASTFAVAAATLPASLRDGAAPFAVASAGNLAESIVSDQLGALDAVEADLITQVAVPLALAPIRVAAVVATREAEPAVLADAAEGAVAKRTERGVAEARTVSRTERVAQRNSRSYRVAVKKARKDPQAKPAQVAARREPAAKRFVTLDGTNDMSMFGRHTYAGIERIVPQETPRRRYSGITRGDRDDG